MNKILVLPIISISTIFSACNNHTGNGGHQRETVKDSIPLCLREKIGIYEKKDAVNPPVQIEEYQYKGKRVFFFTADCCDQFNDLYDDNCKFICAPSGGYTGGGNGKCKDFSDSAKLVKLIWKSGAK